MGRHKISKLQGDLPHQLDYSIGQKIRLRRNLLGLSQKKLAEAIGVSFQQIQKYEKGHNRITISRLKDISQILEVDLSFFLDKILGSKMGSSIIYDTASTATNHLSLALAESSVAYEIDLDQLTTRETIQLIKAYYKIQNPQTRRKVIDLINLMAQDEGK